MPNLKKTPFIINVTIRLYLERVKRDNTVPLFISWQLCTETSWAHGHCFEISCDHVILLQMRHIFHFQWLYLNENNKKK
jgi:hypothetical protein